MRSQKSLQDKSSSNWDKRQLGRAKDDSVKKIERLVASSLLCVYGMESYGALRERSWECRRGRTSDLDSQLTT